MSDGLKTCFDNGIVCHIPGNPVPWQVYTRQQSPPMGVLKCQAWQEQIRVYLRQAWGNQAPLTGPVALDCEFYLPWPDSAPQKHAAAIEKWWQKHRIKKPDRTNLYKAFEDACEGILFIGDQQVLRGEPQKELLNPNYWVDVKEGYTRIRFGPLEEL